jgi:hypothetical protein
MARLSWYEAPTSEGFLAECLSLHPARCSVWHSLHARSIFIPAMKPHSPAITTDALTSVAGRKTRKVQKKLQEAEVDMRSANEVLAHAAAPSADTKEVHDAVERNAIAEKKVHEATEELEVVKEILDHAEGAGPATPPPAGRSGQGVKSLLPHLKATR